MLRKGVIYQPRGRAGEYAPLAVNLYKGCAHGCKYCFAPDATFQERSDFHQPQSRVDIIQKLIKFAPLAKADLDADGIENRRVLLCFTCDPYQPIDTVNQLTRHAINILHDHGFSVNILTKGGHRAERDFDLYQKGDSFATTLTFLNTFDSNAWEPEAAMPDDRIDTIKAAHNLGIETWVSLEPVIDTGQTLQIIEKTHTFVDLYKVGKLNYHPLASKIDWRQFLMDVNAKLDEFGCQRYIKKDLLAYGK